MTNDMHPYFVAKMATEERGENAIRWLFNSYGLDPVNVSFKVKYQNKEVEGFNAVVHFPEGQFHFSYYHFMKDAHEFLIKKEVCIPEGSLEGIEPEIFDLPIWELKSMVEGEYYHKKDELKSLIKIFNSWEKRS